MNLNQERILFEGDTQFNHYQVIDTIYSGRPARVLYSGHRAAAQSGVARDSKSDLLFDYNQRFLELVREVRPKSLLLIGGGAFTLPIKLTEEFPNLKLDVAELDGGLLQMARDYFGFYPNERTQVYIGDGIKFIHNAKDHYDVIILDVFTNTDIPNSFLSAKTAAGLKRCLGPDGILAINVIAALEGHYSKTLRQLRDAVRSAFRQVDIYPASYGLSPWESQNFIVMAHKGKWVTELLMRYSPVILTEKSV